MAKVLCLFCLLFPFLLYAQDNDMNSEQIIEERIDFLLDRDEGSGMDYTTLFDQLEYFYEHPIFLNETDFEELQQLQLLSDFQINNLLEHLSKNGKLIALEELQSIEGFNLNSIRQIAPFVSISTEGAKHTLDPKKIFKNGTSQLFIRYSRILEEKKGFAEEYRSGNPDGAYLGSANKFYTRYKFHYANRLSFGITAEKDAGEEFFKGSNPNGFDFYSAHLFLEDIGFVDQLAIGDFQAQFGQGLTFSSGLAFGISPYVQSIKMNPKGLAPYTSAQEDLFMRGLGATLDLRHFKLTCFYSSHKVDANITSTDTINDLIEISSLPLHGFHRSITELEDKNAIRNSYVGAHLSFRKKSLKLGFTAVQNNISAEYRPKTETYNKFSLLSNANRNIGMDYSYSYKNLSVFGEISHSNNGGIAYTNGALLVVDPRLSLAIQSRNYQRDYQPLQSNAIGEATKNTNEKGTYIGMNARPHPHFLFSAYVDRFSFPWLKYRVDAPSYGFRHLLQLEYEPSKKLKIYVRYRNRNKGKNVSRTMEGLDEVVQESMQNYRFHLSYQVTEDIRLKSRLEYLTYQLGENKKEDGILLYQDLQYKNRNFPFSFSFRFAVFETNSYDSRIYAYENDVLYAFSIPAYYSKGSRFYVLTKYHIYRGVDLWLRYAQTYYSDLDTIGSGKEEIDGNTKSEIKVQLRYKF